MTRELRDLCVFSAHSLIRDPPFSRLDLVSCRNLLIYLGGDMQRRLVPLFHYALRPGGWLFLGAAERSAVRRPVRADRTHEPDLPPPRTPRHGQPAALVARRPHALGRMDGGKRPLPAALPLRQIAERRLLDRFVPPHVVVNREGDALHYGAGIGRYLEIMAGAPSRHVISMARRGLRLDLRTALHEAMETRRPARRDGGEVEADGRIQPVAVVVEPIGDDPAEPLFLVLFIDQGAPLDPAGRHQRVRDGSDVAERLEQELRDARDRLQVTIEEYETALEELKSANEELVSMNEELQSTNEEMQTAKEEQQSVNEELQTVNVDLHEKIVALDRANADLRNLFDSTQVATSSWTPGW